jgi:hypothetical protein
MINQPYDSREQGTLGLHMLHCEFAGSSPAGQMALSCSVFPPTAVQLTLTPFEGIIHGRRSSFTAEKDHFVSRGNKHFMGHVLAK